MDHIFLSYARADGRGYVEQLDQDLQQAGYKTWWDKRTLDPYQDFSAEIEVGIREASHVAVCVTPSVERNPTSFVRREIIYAQAKQKPIIPLVFPNADLPVLINHLTYIPFFKGKHPPQELNYTEGFAHLVKRLAQPAAVSPAPPSDDPFKAYLQGMYEFIVTYLKQTVFSLVDLKGIETPDAVENSRSQTLPVSFMQVMWDMAGLAAPAVNPTEFHNFHEAFEHYGGRLLLLGEPGAGKTTTLLAFARDKIAARLADPNQPLPLYAPIVTWDAHDQPSLSSWLSGLVPSLSQPIQTAIHTGQALLILDGLDELGKERKSPVDDEVYDPRARFVQKLPAHNHIILSSRIKDHQEVGNDIPLQGALTLQPLDDAQLEQYFLTLKLPLLWNALRRDAALKEVARTPLLLSLFTVAFQNATSRLLEGLEGKLGNDLRDHIFETFLTHSYQREQRKPHAVLPFSLDELKTKLGQIASKNVARFGGRDVITLRLIASVIYKPAKREALIELAERLHLLTPLLGDGYRFVHLLLRDYLAYRYALAVLHQAPEADEDLVLEAVQTLTKLADPRAYAPLKHASQSPRPYVAAMAAAALWTLGDEGALETLIEALAAEAWYVRVFAIQTLGQSGDARAVDPLIALLQHPDPNTRMYTAQALGQLGDPLALPALIYRLGEAKSSVRVASALALGQLGQVEAIPALVAALQDPDVNVRANAIRALGELGASEAVPILIGLLESTIRLPHRQIGLCDVAAEALEQIGTPEALTAVQQWRE